MRRARSRCSCGALRRAGRRVSVSGREVCQKLPPLPTVVLEVEGPGRCRASERMLSHHYSSGQVWSIPTLDGRKRPFRADGEHIVNKETGRVWNITGKAVSREFVGQQLEQVRPVNNFWFAWALFKFDTKIYQGAQKHEQAACARLNATDAATRAFDRFPSPLRLSPASWAFGRTGHPAHRGERWR